MLRRSTKVQLILFVLITLLGVSYVSAEYVGLAKYVVGDDGCTVSADFQNSGGIFSNAEVTYRGVTVGKVGELSLIGRSTQFPAGGVKAKILLDDCGDPHIPANVSANVANRSVVGEQYINLIPAANSGTTGPFLQQNQLIPASRTSTPVPTEKLLVDLNRLITSVPLDALRTTISELGKAVANRGPALGSLLDSTNSLLVAANQPDNLNATLGLIRDSATVLQTQLDVRQPLQSWTRSLNLLSAQLKKSDPDIRRLLDDGPSSLNTISSFISTNKGDLGIVLSNLITTNNLIVSHLGGLEQVFELYPALASGGQSVLRNREGKLNLILQATPTPQDCGDPFKDNQGYNGTVRRTPDQIASTAPNVTVRCTAPASSGTNLRGSAYVPGGDPISLSGGGYAYPRASTSSVQGSTSSTKSATSTRTAASTARSTGPLQIGPSLTDTSGQDDPRYVTLLTSALH